MNGNTPSPESSDDDLVAVASGGGDLAAAAREQLVVRYTPLVRAAAGSLAEDRDLRDDAIQAGYSGLLRAIERFDGTHGATLGSFARKFVRGSAQRLVLRERRQTSVSQLYAQTDAMLPDATTTPGPDVAYEASLALAAQPEIQRAVRLFVSCLPKDLHYVAIRLYWHNASQTEIAAEMGVSKMMVTKHVRAIQRRGRAELANLRDHASAA